MPVAAAAARGAPDHPAGPHPLVAQDQRSPLAMILTRRDLRGPARGANAVDQQGAARSPERHARRVHASTRVLPPPQPLRANVRGRRPLLQQADTIVRVFNYKVSLRTRVIEQLSHVLLTNIRG